MSKKLCAKYGEKLVCVRYQYDDIKRKRYKTVELIIDEVDWKPGTRKRNVSPRKQAARLYLCETSSLVEELGRTNHSSGRRLIKGVFHENIYCSH